MHDRGRLSDSHLAMQYAIPDKRTADFAAFDSLMEACDSMSRSDEAIDSLIGEAWFAGLALPRAIRVCLSIRNAAK